nr:hypothetical protein [Tanacetum cinerariifolium]
MPASKKRNSDTFGNIGESSVMNIDNGTSKLVSVQQRRHRAPSTSQNYNLSNNHQTIHGGANVNSHSVEPSPGDHVNTSTSIARDVPTKEPTNFCCMLPDKEREFHDLAAETKKWQQTLDNNTTLIFRKYTSVDPISCDPFPVDNFKFTAYNEVDSKADVDGATLTDNIGPSTHNDKQQSTSY